jgi:hypothetical protein
VEQQQEAHTTTTTQNGAVANGAAAKETPVQQTSTEPQPRDENKSEGPCGLPFKCSVC